MTKSIHKMMGNKAKGTRIHSTAEIYSKTGLATDVRDKLEEAIASGSVVTKAERFVAMKKLTKEAYEAAHPEVQALCLAKVQEERETKASQLLKPKTQERTNLEALEECTGPIAHFLQAIHEMTGFHWTVLGAGPDPRYNGDINMMSYHTGVNEYGQNWKQATPDFDDKHIKPYVAFISSLFPHTPIAVAENTHQPPPDTWYSIQHPDDLISFDTGYDFVADSPSSPSFSPISTWKRDMLPTSPPHFRLQVLAANFASSTSPSDIIGGSSPTPFITPPMFTFPPLPAPPLAPWSFDASSAYVYLPSTFSPTTGTQVLRHQLLFHFLHSQPHHWHPVLQLPAVSSVTVSGNLSSANGSRIDTLVGVEALAAVVVLEAVRVDSDRNVTTSSEPISEGNELRSACAENLPASGKRIQKVLADPEIPTKSTSSTLPVRKTGRLRTETTRLVQANNIGQNPKRPRPAESQSEHRKKRK
ncbi:uncharacterized protein HD556DRAFT_1311564 [Suillus plorans]|uniref:Uncharacterized protein n=1 Tax=Suillus plorans TaxID=116603 RepID=A0A9P7AH40_9AGAM|nr:uncharacterized protein HD556DRAFT_1311564 [Suillus plorans]KAG1789191.1 hypothetical protein HD556DRAFT_1311564 [Suillus plorans]